MSVPGPSAFPDHDRGHPLNTLHSLPRPVHEVCHKLIRKYPCESRIFIRDDDPARGYIISTIFFVSGIVTLLQSVIGCRLPIIQGGTFTFVAPTLAILSLETKWSRPCPDFADEDTWGIMGEEERQELWQARILRILTEDI